MIEIHHTDCREFMKTIESGSIDLVLTDPPYYSTNLAFDKAPRIDFEAWLTECKRVLKPNGILVSFADFNLLADLRSKKVFKSTYELIWHKTMAVGFLQANQRPLMTHEYIGVFTENRNSTTYNPQKSKGVSYGDKGKNKTGIYSATGDTKRIKNEDGKRHPKTVIKFSNQDDSRGIHPTQKPVDLLQWLIKTYSNEGDTVLDCFMGSGSTGVAAFNNKRKFIGCELDAAYFAIAEKRLLDNKHDLVGLFT
jgi:site-specific DNA-methyltransferase (adenine-specific)